MSETNNGNENGTMIVDFFSLTESKNFDPNKEARCFRLELSEDLSPEECLSEYYAQGFPKGSHRAGVIEIQCDKWTATTTDRKRMDFKKKADRIEIENHDEIEDVLAFGGGVDSTALLAMHLDRPRAAEILGITIEDLNRHLPKFSAVVFSDPGAEYQATYRNIETARQLCEDRDLRFEVVRREGENITEWVTRLGIVPVMPGGHHICSLKYKGEVMAKWAVEEFGGEEKVRWSIGIEFNEGHRVTRFEQSKKSKASSSFPLVALKIDRAKCEQIISELWPHDVVKSSCVFCPFMQESEIKNLTKCGESFEIAKKVEARFEESSKEKHQAWLDAGKPLNKAGRAPRGMWRKDSFKEGARLFARKVDGKQLSLKEWDEKLNG